MGYSEGGVGRGSEHPSIVLFGAAACYLLFMLRCAILMTSLFHRPPAQSLFNTRNSRVRAMTTVAVDLLSVHAGLLCRLGMLA